MQGFIKVTGCPNKKTLRINISGICHYEEVKLANDAGIGTQFYFLGWDDSIRVFESPEEIDEMIRLFI